jgi:hypothetical protein
MNKNRKNLIWGIVVGVVVATGGWFIYHEYFQKSELERKAEKFERNVNKEIKKAKKLFE